MNIMPDFRDGCNDLSFRALLKNYTIWLINLAEDASERESRIQIAHEEGALSYDEAYALRTDGEL